MRKASQGSCAYLKGLVERFQAFHRKHSGLDLSMREISGTGLKQAGGLPGDVQRLARWTNPNARSSWRIPLAHISPVTFALGGDQRDVDTLMVYRLSELENENPAHEAVVAANWASDFTQRLNHEEDRRLLEILRSLRDRYPHGVPEGVLEEALERLFMAQHEVVEAGFPHEEPDPESEAARQRVLAALARSLAGRASAPRPPPPPRGKVRRAARDYLQGLAKRRP